MTLVAAHAARLHCSGIGTDSCQALNLVDTIMREPKNSHTLPDATHASLPSLNTVVHLDAMLQRKDQAAFNNALRQMVQTQGGFTEVANEAGLNRTALYRIVSTTHDAKLSTVLALLSSLGLKLSVKRAGRYNERVLKPIRKLPTSA